MKSTVDRIGGAGRELNDLSGATAGPADPVRILG